MTVEARAHCRLVGVRGAPALPWYEMSRIGGMLRPITIRNARVTFYTIYMLYTVKGKPARRNDRSYPHSWKSPSVGAGPGGQAARSASAAIMRSTVAVSETSGGMA